MNNSDPICTVCGHLRSEHHEEMPYECVNGEGCDCYGFSYIELNDPDRLYDEWVDRQAEIKEL